MVSALIDVINMPQGFQKNRWSRSPLLESRSKFSCENYGISEINYYQVERATSSNFWDMQIISLFGNSGNKSRLSIVLFFKRYFLVLEAL